MPGENADCAGCAQACSLRWLDTTDQNLYCATCWQDEYGEAPPAEEAKCRHQSMLENGSELQCAACWEDHQSAEQLRFSELSGKSHSDLKALCKEAGVAVSGTKAKLIENLLNPNPKKGRSDAPKTTKKAKGNVCASCGNTSSSPLLLKLYCSPCWEAEGAVNESVPSDHGHAGGVAPAEDAMHDEDEGDIYDVFEDKAKGESGPTVPLGADGFRLIRNAMGVHGFHVALNPFSESLHERLFREPAFTRNTQADCPPRHDDQ